MSWRGEECSDFITIPSNVTSYPSRQCARAGVPRRRRRAPPARCRRPRALRHRDRQRPHRHHRPGGAGRPCAVRSRQRHRAAAPRRRAHPHRQGPHLASRAQSGRLVHGRAHDRDGGPRGQLVGRGCRQAHGLFAALRLRARHRRAAHAYRHRSASRRRSRGACSPRCARQWKGRVTLAGGVALSDRIRDRRRGRNSAPWSRRSRAMAACSAGSPIMGEPLGAEDRCGARQGVRGRQGATASISISMWTRAIHPTRARSGGSPTPRCATSSHGQDRRRPLLLARARRRRRARRDHRQGGGGRHRGRVAADVQHVSAGSARPAARRAGAASRRCTSSPRPASP